jgi:hypothetical protein
MQAGYSAQRHPSRSDCGASPDLVQQRTPRSNDGQAAQRCALLTRAGARGRAKVAAAPPSPALAVAGGRPRWPHSSLPPRQRMGTRGGIEGECIAGHEVARAGRLLLGGADRVIRRKCGREVPQRSGRIAADPRVLRCDFPELRPRPPPTGVAARPAPRLPVRGPPTPVRVVPPLRERLRVHSDEDPASPKGVSSSCSGALAPGFTGARTRSPERECEARPAVALDHPQNLPGIAVAVVGRDLQRRVVVR